MQNITIGRYGPGEAVFYRVDLDTDGNETSRTPIHAFAGWVEGVRNDGSTWRMDLDEHGCPDYFWAQCDPGGGVMGDPIVLE